jgi:hypothetical protein
MPSAYQIQQAREREEARQRGEIHQAGGGDGIADFFSKENRDRPIKRGELLGLLEMLEYSRASHAWWRTLGRLLTRTPGIQNLPRQMRRAYWRSTLKPALDAVKGRLERQAKAANDAAGAP